jgi:hypothetical protein
MATVQNPPRQAVIRVSPLEGRSSAAMELLRALPAWIISAGIHGLMFLLFVLLVGDPRSFGSDTPQTPVETINTKIEAPQQEVILTNPDIGLDPSLPTNYDVNLIKDVSVPGPADPNAAVGIAGGSPNAPQVTIPPPPGSGRGQGGAPDLPGVDGTGLSRELIGGYGGLTNVPGGFAGRSGATRQKMLQEGGGSGESEAAVARGLEWLALHQAPQGHWALDQWNLHARAKLTDGNFLPPVGNAGLGRKNDTAGAAFGVLPFLAAGITHKPGVGKKAQMDNKYVKTVARALDYLMHKQGRDGDFGGGMYSHGLATIAICEAYGLTADPKLRSSAQAGLNFIVSAQNPSSGGWRYQPRQGGDTSVVGWQVMALKSGQMSGLNVPSITLKGAEKWLDSCESSDKGKFGYIGPNPTYTMTAVGLLCRQYLGIPRRNPSLRSGCDWLLQNYPPSGPRNIYYQYYATQVMHHMGGEYWDKWNTGTNGKKGMRDTLISSQEKAGPNTGSFDPGRDVHGRQGGRVMQTALCLLTLEVYYRHLPLYQRVKTKK